VQGILEEKEKRAVREIQRATKKKVMLRVSGGFLLGAAKSTQAEKQRRSSSRDFKRNKYVSHRKGGSGEFQSGLTRFLREPKEADMGLAPEGHMS